MPKAAWTGSVERIRRCTTARGRRGQRLYAFEGERLLKRAIAAGIQIEELVLGADLASSSEAAATSLGDLVRRATSRGAVLSRAPMTVLEELAEGRVSGQVVTLARLPEPLALRDILVQQSGDTSPLLVAVDVDEPGNVGALVRTALCSGVGSFVAVGSTDPFHPKAVRTSMGAIFKLPWSWLPSAVELATAFAGLPIHRAAAVAEQGTPLALANLGPERAAIYVGNEARGLSAEICEQADERVTIAMADGVDSFSVNAAAAILLYEANRRRAR